MRILPGINSLFKDWKRWLFYKMCESQHNVLRYAKKQGNMLQKMSKVNLQILILNKYKNLTYLTKIQNNHHRDVYEFKILCMNKNENINKEATVK
jgi:hypothetical protein